MTEFDIWMSMDDGGIEWTKVYSFNADRCFGGLWSMCSVSAVLGFDDLKRFPEPKEIKNIQTESSQSVRFWERLGKAVGVGYHFKNLDKLQEATSAPLNQGDMGIQGQFRHIVTPHGSDPRATRSWLIRASQ
ncbi:hypothetical protein QJS10_CPB04g00915 [Acorus calamus]|uniref:Uncharacterized protein n=1 Tax=Acorus calamus TaxID=4465 RepID=A0AAV9EZC2_ACOCL|nr:hypothetical protein QJS10_CPB04g00915 [Acorus calamus]